jgi:hypothetical protein
LNVEPFSHAILFFFASYIYHAMKGVQTKENGWQWLVMTDSPSLGLCLKFADMMLLQTSTTWITASNT